jgi:hypothetical protein
MLRFNHRRNTWQARMAEDFGLPGSLLMWEDVTPDHARELWALGFEVREDWTIPA